MTLAHALLDLPRTITLAGAPGERGPNGEVVVTGSYLVPPRTCGREHCCRQITWNAPKPRTLQHMTAGRRRVWLQLEVGQYRCASAGHTFVALPPICLPRARISLLLTTEVQWMLHLGLPLATVADLAGLDQATINRVFRLYTDLARARPRRAPRALGIDEIYLDGKARSVLVSLDPDDRRVVALLPVKSAQAVFEAIHRLDDPTRIERVVIDLDRAFRAVSRELIRTHCPNADIVHDPFHVIGLAIKAAKKCLMRIRRQHYPRSSRALNGLGTIMGKAAWDWTTREAALFEATQARHPEIREVHTFYQNIRSVYRLDSADAALRYLAELEEEMERSPVLTNVYTGFFKTVNAHVDDIVRHFEEALTAGFTESRNRELRRVYDGGRGWRETSWPTFEALVLLRYGDWTYQHLQSLWADHVNRTLASIEFDEPDGDG